MTYIGFALLSRLYDIDFTTTPLYASVQDFIGFASRLHRSSGLACTPRCNLYQPLHQESYQGDGAGRLTLVTGGHGWHCLLGIDTLRWMVIVRQSSWWILTPTLVEQPPTGGEGTDEESSDESDSKSSLPFATAPMGSPSIVALPWLRSKI